MDTTPKTSPNWTDDLRLVLRLAKRTGRKWRAGAVAFAVVFAVTAAWVVLGPKQYRSETVVYHREGLQWSAGEAPSSRRMSERFRDTLLSRQLLTRVIEATGLYPKLVQEGRIVEAVEEMRLLVGFQAGQGDVYTISYLGDSPEEAQAVTAKLGELLVADYSKLVTEQAVVAGDFLANEKKRTEAELAAKEAAVLAFLAKHPEFATEQNPLGGSLRARSRQGPTATSAADNEALAALRREEERLRRQLTSPEQSRPTQDSVLTAVKEEAEAKLRAAQRDLAEKRTAYTEEHPDVRAAEVAVKEAQARYREAVAAVDAAQPRALEGRLSQIQQEIAAVRRLASQGMPAQVDTTHNSEAAKRIVADEAEWARLNREATEARERFAALENRQFVASMTASMAASGQSSQIRVIDPAYLPVRPSGRGTTARLVVGFLLALVAAAFVAFGSALNDDRVLEAADVERLGLGPVLLDLPADPSSRKQPEATALAAATAGPPQAQAASTSTALVVSASPNPALVRVHRLEVAPAKDPRLIMLREPGSPAAAAYRVLRHRLRERGDPRTILVTSPGRGEGKSACALNLALALVEGDRARAVLLEANGHAPLLARLLGFEPPLCAADQLEHRRQRPGQPWEAVETWVPGLHAVPMATGSKPRPIQDGALNLFVSSFRLAGYDYIVIDAPDALGSADVTVMQESVDGLLMVARGASTRARSIRAAVDQAGAGRLQGFALLGSSSDSHAG